MKIKSKSHISQLGINKVLIKLNETNDFITLSNGTKFLLDYKYRVAEHTQVIGTVVKVPHGLYFDADDYIGSMDHLTTMDLLVGDVVFMDYLAVILALADRYDYAASYPDPKWIEIDGCLHIFVDYQELFFAKRGDSLIMLNGYCIAEPINRLLGSGRFSLLDNLKESHQLAQIIYPGTAITEFFDDRDSDLGEYEKGDVVLFSNWSNQKVEDPLHQTLFDGKKYVVIQRKWILGKGNSDLRKFVEDGSLV